MSFNATVIHTRILKEFENRWYLVGYSEDHECIRTFGLDRLYDPVLLKKKFIPANQEKEDVYLKDVYGVYPYSDEKKQTIIIRANSLVINYLMAYPIHSSQQVKNRGQYGHGEVTFDLIPSHELIRLFRSYGNEIEVIQPEWINTEIFQEKRKWQRRR